MAGKGNARLTRSRVSRLTGSPSPRASRPPRSAPRQPPSASGVGRYSAGKALGERALEAGFLPAIEPPHQQGNAEFLPEGWEGGQEIAGTGCEPRGWRRHSAGNEHDLGDFLQE